MVAVNGAVSVFALRCGLMSYSQPLRLLSTSSQYRSQSREARILMKMLSSKQERKVWSSKTQPVTIKSAVHLLGGRKASVLNKMFMRNISESLTCGDFDSILYGREIHITRVAVDITFKALYVFWVSNDSEDSVEVQNLLTGVAGKIKEKLTYANMLGRVPDIKFRKDLDEVRYQSTMKALQSINVEPFSMHETEPQPTLACNDISVPVMRLDTLGLNYSGIIERINKAKSGSYPLTAPIPPSIDESGAEKDSQVVNNENIYSKLHQQKKDLRKFMAIYKKSMLHHDNRPRDQQSCDILSMHDDDDDDDNADADEYDKFSNAEVDFESDPHSQH